MCHPPVFGEWHGMGDLQRSFVAQRLGSNWVFVDVCVVRDAWRQVLRVGQESLRDRDSHSLIKQVWDVACCSTSTVTDIGNSEFYHRKTHVPGKGSLPSELWVLITPAKYLRSNYLLEQSCALISTVVGQQILFLGFSTYWVKALRAGVLLLLACCQGWGCSQPACPERLR